jgi:hypothetical protein
MQKTRGLWSTVAAVTALACCCLGICYGLQPHKPKQRFQSYAKYEHDNATQRYPILYDADNGHYNNGDR